MPRWNPPPAVRRFFGWPTLGGWLTIGNCLGWAGIQLFLFVAGPRGLDNITSTILTVVFLVISSPLAFAFWLPNFARDPSFDDIIAMAVMAGVNAIVWGYGLAWIAGKVTERTRELKGEAAGSPERGVVEWLE